MGLTRRSVGRAALDAELSVKRREAGDLVVALAGNPNVGKSTVFNALTGMHQHTGNWPGKTVANAQGYCTDGEQGFVFVDIPGTYSLLAHSAEEEIARDYLCFGEPDAVAVVCDATCLLRNLNLVLQILEFCPHVVVCVNLLDEAKRKRVGVDLARLSQLLGVPVVGTVARRKRTLTALLAALRYAASRGNAVREIRYDETVETAITEVATVLAGRELRALPPRWLALRLLEGDPALSEELAGYLGAAFENAELAETLTAARARLSACGYDAERLRDAIVTAVSAEASAVARETVSVRGGADRDRRIDRVLTGKFTAFPLMLLMLAGVFWLTIVGANYPSRWLAVGFEWIGKRFSALLLLWHAPPFLYGLLYEGAFRVLAAVVSVMLPPMAIFFPLFTLMEDVGVLPRIAYNLDRPFCRCHACGKQALTMCMGLGCNAAGVVGCRIIDSPRERLLAVLTNAFVPCNGRFPAMITMITFFFAVSAGVGGTFVTALILTAFLLLSVVVTFAATRLLSATLLSGSPSSFTLELPPYRRPQVGKVIVRSVFDRTLFVLGRAAAVAVPTGAVIWLLAATRVGEVTLLSRVAGFLDPFGRFLGLDGVILLAFFLGLPANEIVLPIVMMTYLAEESLPVLGTAAGIGAVLTAHGWTRTTAVCFLIFSLFHWPCATTLLTVKRETGKLRWCAVAALLPTLFGVVLCALISCFS